MKNHSLYYQVALSAALKAGQILRDMRVGGFELTKKGARDLLTSADLAAEKAVIEEIRAHFPDHHILSEEASPETTSSILSQDAVWIIDPIDGTTNFAHGHQMVATSIAFAVKGKIQAGVVHAPFLNETFAAERTLGATLNDRPIQCANADHVGDFLVATGFPYNRHQTDLLTRRLKNVLDNCRDIRRLGSAALDICWVACGRLDAYYETCMVWDMAAGALIAREAGAAIGHSCDVPTSWSHLEELFPTEMIVTNKNCFVDFKALIRDA